MQFEPDRNHPINQVFDRIEIRCPFRPLAALEPFGGGAVGQIIHYANRPSVVYLEAWDINEVQAAKVKTLFPQTQVKITNAFDQVSTLQPHYDVILIDNNLFQVPFEHFDLFPAVFKGLVDDGFLVVSICPDPGGYYMRRESLIRGMLGSRIDSFIKDWDAARQAFYKIEGIDYNYDVIMGRIVPLSAFAAYDMVTAYTNLALKAGFFTAYHTVIDRSRDLKYILIQVKRMTARLKLEAKTKDKLEKNAANDNKP